MAGFFRKLFLGEDAKQEENKNTKQSGNTNKNSGSRKPSPANKSGARTRSDKGGSQRNSGKSRNSNGKPRNKSNSSGSKGSKNQNSKSKKSQSSFSNEPQVLNVRRRSVSSKEAPMPARAPRPSSRKHSSSSLTSTRLASRAQGQTRDSLNREYEMEKFASANFVRNDSVRKLLLKENSNHTIQVAMVEDDILVEYYLAEHNKNSILGNIYLGKITTVLPSMEASFVDIGEEKNGILYTDEVNWDVKNLDAESVSTQDVMKEGELILVQVTKNPYQHKGSRVTSKITIPGKYLVLSPLAQFTGVSKKIDSKRRSELLTFLKGKLPEGMGAIVRTDAEEVGTDIIEAELNRLIAVWNSVKEEAAKQTTPTLIRRGPDMSIRVVRDIFDSSFSELILDGDDIIKSIKEEFPFLPQELKEKIIIWNPDEYEGMKGPKHKKETGESADKEGSEDESADKEGVANEAGASGESNEGSAVSATAESNEGHAEGDADAHAEGDDSSKGDSDKRDSGKGGSEKNASGSTDTDSEKDSKADSGKQKNEQKGDSDEHEEKECEDLFERFNIYPQIAKSLNRKVWLPSGGTLIFDKTEAMTIIDVNTGKFTGAGGSLEDTVTANNLEAAEEIVHQLRLRDIGGIIIVDFIDMIMESNQQKVYRRLYECLKRDESQHSVAEVTSLGLIQITRKKVGIGLIEAFSKKCRTCSGLGYIIDTSSRRDMDLTAKVKNVATGSNIKKKSNQKEISQVAAASGLLGKTKGNSAKTKTDKTKNGSDSNAGAEKTSEKKSGNSKNTESAKKTSEKKSQNKKSDQGKKSDSKADKAAGTNRKGDESDAHDSGSAKKDKKDKTVEYVPPKMPVNKNTYDPKNAAKKGEVKVPALSKSKKTKEVKTADAKNIKKSDSVPKLAKNK